MDNFLAHILIVDDDEGIRSLVKKYLSENKYIVNIQCNKKMHINANKYFLNKIKNISNIITINNMY